MEWNVKYNVEKDLEQVDQFGYINLREAVSNGVIPASAQVVEDAYNEIEDLDSISGKPSDIFEAMQYGVSVNKVAKSAASEKEGDD